ncbi:MULTISPECIES: DUF1819 family protein [Actinomyces]|uniref:DUF1819 family protein n=1 Tax=Actinomyces respiraculi TaxID=2744574 RepID=A0A7T0LJQ0_9ACTO|nr:MULTISPECIES: DUF1819 family protein [Actinomyces]QPL04902.1 DUF1819 family protein [Actinomyces respiraculi]
MASGVRVRATVPTPYRLSFVVGGLLSTEAMITAPLYLGLHDWTAVRSVLIADNLLHARTRATAVRLAREVVQRMSTLSDVELSYLATALSPDRRHLMWAAACRHYEIVADFAHEVLRDHYLRGIDVLIAADFERFWDAKALWHGELEETTPSTRAKIRTNLFLAMRQAGLLEEGSIVTPLMSRDVRMLLEQRTPSDLRFFPVRSSL